MHTSQQTVKHLNHRLNFEQNDVEGKLGVIFFFFFDGVVNLRQLFEEAVVNLGYFERWSAWVDDLLGGFGGKWCVIIIKWLMQVVNSLMKRAWVGQPANNL